LLPFIWLWFVLLNDLRMEWTVDPQYNYGWAVPFLCLYLWGRNIFNLKSGRRQPEIHLPQIPAFGFHFILIGLAFLYAPTRLIQEANPGWRLVSWALALEVIGLTLCLLRMRSGPVRFGFFTFVFPVCFFLVAVPWPTLLEGPLIQALTRMDVGATCELTNWLGIPAIPHGNVIEVATGAVGIDEACSGIRSFQATLMLSLFLGEFYRLGAGRRIICVLAGFLLALTLNLTRLSVLVWVAAHKGIPAIAGWHDPAGVIILLGCFFALWGIGRKLATINSQTEVLPSSPTNRNQTSETCFLTSAPNFIPYALAAWILLVETGVEGWYRYHEARLPAPVEWRVEWPTDNMTYKEQELAPITRQLLRYSDARYATWQEGSLNWQVIFVHWKPGTIAQRLAGEHTPQACLVAAGHKFIGGKELHYLTAQGLKLPFRFYQLTDTPQPVFEAYCLWDDRANTRSFEATRLSYAWRLPPVWAGLRNSGQRVIEIAVIGAQDSASAQVAIQNLLEKIISPIH